MTQAESIPRESVLLIVPEGGTRQRIGKAIADAGYQSVLAHDLDAARRELASGLTPCLIVLFLSSHHEAAGFLEELQRDPGHERLPVVMFSTGTTQPPAEPTAPLFSAILHLVERHCEP